MPHRPRSPPLQTLVTAAPGRAPSSGVDSLPQRSLVTWALSPIDHWKYLTRVLMGRVECADRCGLSDLHRGGDSSTRVFISLSVHLDIKPLTFPEVFVLSIFSSLTSTLGSTLIPDFFSFVVVTECNNVTGRELSSHTSLGSGGLHICLPEVLVFCPNGKGG